MSDNTKSKIHETILDKIVSVKRKEIELAKQQTSLARLEQSEFFNRECYQLRQFLLDSGRSGIISEFKRQSPSKGIINNRSSVTEVTTAYAEAGASAISVLTDQQFFGGKNEDLIEARRANQVPLLRKDFMLDEYQLLEAKALGADIILLIASILKPEEILNLSGLAKKLGMNVLLEVHNMNELERSLCDTIDAVGVNNRNLAELSVILEQQ